MILGQVAKEYDHFIEKMLGVRIIAVLLHLPLAIANHHRTAADETGYYALVLGVCHHLTERTKSTLAATVQNLSCKAHAALNHRRITLRYLLTCNNAFGLS